MKSSRPYLVRALYDWIVDNGCTPFVLVDAHCSGVEVPQQYVKNGQIVLNVSPGAVANLLMSNDDLRFRGRFGGVPVEIVAPMASILGIYARENGQGMVFEPETPGSPPPGDGGSPESTAPAGRPSLRVVK